MNHYKLTIEYDGTNYVGFQKQFILPKKSIEEILENVIFSMSQEKAEIIVAGRTDAGVHALRQVINFSLEKKFKTHQIVFGLNSYLRGKNIVILTCELVDENFHARFNAKMRHYRYIIVNRSALLALQKNRAWHVPEKLDIEVMKKVSKLLIGEHDFSSFRDAECQSKSPIKTIEKIEIIKNNDEILIEVSAKSFLHHMVRNIVGTIAWMGCDKIKEEKMTEILAAKDRTKSGPNAPACGLYFVGVDY